MLDAVMRTHREAVQRLETTQLAHDHSRVRLKEELTNDASAEDLVRESIRRRLNFCWLGKGSLILNKVKPDRCLWN
jgi:hypothetical protein